MGQGQGPYREESGAIYYYQCGELTHTEEYIGETSRTFEGKIQRTPEGTCTHSCG